MASYSKNIASNFVIRIVRIITGFLISIFLARALGPEGKGYVTFFVMVFTLVASYGHFGINNATTYFQKRSDYNQEIVYTTNLTSLILIWIILSGISIGLYLANFLLVDYPLILLFEGCVFVILKFFQISTRNFYVGNERIVEINKFFLVNSLLVFFGVLFTWWFKLLTPVFYITLKVTGLLVNTIFLLKNLDIQYSFQFDFSLLWAELKYGALLYFAALFMYLTFRVDQLLIKQFVGVTDLGIYSISVALAELVLLIPKSVTSAIAGKLYNINIENQSKRAFITSTTVKYTFYSSVAIGTLGFFMKPLIPIVYGIDFVNAVQPFVILLGGVVFASIGRVAYPYFTTKGRPEIYFSITFVVFVLNLVLNFLLIPQIGIIGAAYASTAAYFVYGLSHLMYLIIKEKFDFTSFFVPRKRDFVLLKNILKRLV